MKFTFQFWVRSISSEPFERVLLKFTQLFLSVGRCVEPLTQGQGYNSMLWASAAGDLVVHQTAILSK